MKSSLKDWLHDLESIHPKSIDLGLERCSDVYLRMGEPHPARDVWVVAGTNGKGSVVAYLDSLLRADGLSCGSFTSPHILSFNERIRVNGRPASDDMILAAFERVEAARAGVSLTYFEFTTLAAFQIMHEARLDAAVLEVGLGGRLDAVNLVDADCAVITRIGLDHQEYLGPDRESIAREKAGIMRPHRPAVVGDPEPPDSLVRHGLQIGASLLQMGQDFSVTADSGSCEFRMGAWNLRLARPPLAGWHQVENLATALAALAQLRPGLLSKPATLDRGIRAARLPGRLQAWAGDPRILLDVGHNPLAAEAVAECLRGQPRERCYCVLAMLVDKDAEGVAGHLDGLVSHWLCAGLHGGRGQAGEDLARRLAGRVAGRVESYRDVAAALAAARALASHDDLILVFGSFVTVGEAMQALNAVGYS